LKIRIQHITPETDRTIRLRSGTHHTYIPVIPEFTKPKSQNLVDYESEDFFAADLSVLHDRNMREPAQPERPVPTARRAYTRCLRRGGIGSNIVMQLIPGVQLPTRAVQRGTGFPPRPRRHGRSIIAGQCDIKRETRSAIKRETRTGRFQVRTSTQMECGVTILLDPTLEVRCAQYQREFHLPASIDPTSRHILLELGTGYGAITMPADLGERVQQRLAQAGLAGPVVHHPRARRWTFITGPSRSGGLTASVSAELFRLYATVACTGSQVVLPSADDERTGYRTWVQPPQTGTVPPLAAVVAAIRAVSERKALPH
jgi:hypothetical protein